MFKRIIVAVDDSSQAFDAAKSAAVLAAQLGADLLLATAVAPPVPVALGDMAIAEAESPKEAMARGRNLLEKVRSGLDLPSSLRVEQRAVEGYPADQIVSLARDWKADLIVVGTHGRHGIPRLLLGSTAEAISRRAPCSVLVARPRTLVL